VKVLVVYDSKWGNKELIANAVAAAIGKNAKAIKIDDLEIIKKETMDLLIIGSPVIGGKPTKLMQEYIKGIPQTVTKKVRVATFDTRMTMKFAQKFGFAAVRIANELKDQGNTLISEPMGFIVIGQKGPLAEGELERASKWGKDLAKLK
jgi:flavodoxin